MRIRYVQKRSQAWSPKIEPYQRDRNKQTG